MTRHSKIHKSLLSDIRLLKSELSELKSENEWAEEMLAYACNLLSQINDLSLSML